MPTILELRRVPLPAAPLMPGAVQAAGEWTERPALTEKAVTTEPLGAPPPMDTESFAIVSGGYNVIHNSKRPAGGPGFELDDNRRDPLDKTDVAGAHPEIVARLAKEIAGWRARAESERLKPDAVSEEKMSPEQLDRLRAPGYIQ
jgi:hypothetical protein